MCSLRWRFDGWYHENLSCDNMNQRKYYTLFISPLYVYPSTFCAPLLFPGWRLRLSGFGLRRPLPYRHCFSSTLYLTATQLPPVSLLASTPPLSCLALPCLALPFALGLWVRGEYTVFIKFHMLCVRVRVSLIIHILHIISGCHQYFVDTLLPTRFIRGELYKKKAMMMEQTNLSLQPCNVPT